MRIVIDSNVLFSALIRDSTTRKIILDYDGLFLFPGFVFDEMNKHKAVLFEKSGMSKDEFNELLQIILDKAEIVPNNITKPYMREANELVKNIDADDKVFVACALAYPNSILWSNDHRLKAIRKITVKNTEEVIQLSQG